MIKQKSVEEILEVAKVEDVVEDFVSLKRRGVNMIGLCPFHNEKTPSFTVSPAKNIFKCFGCGQAGGPVQFLMEHESLTFPEALRWLANKYGIKIEETEQNQEEIAARQHKDSLYIINEFAKDYFQNNLFDSDQGKRIGLSYFKERGFREETIKKFGLGYADNVKDDFTREAVLKGYNIDLLRKLGLTNKFDGDFFRDRVMFTIHNVSGKVVGFGGRTLQKGKKIPKYINTPETEIYNKSKTLYGAYFAKRGIRQEDECIMVEGYTDVLSLHQAGIENVVASSGTSLTVEQIRLVKRFTPNIKILYDGDLAGIKAALRGLDLVLEQDMNVKVVLLPEGEDPDSYLEKVGTTAFKEFIKDEAKDFILFKTSLLMEEAAGDPVKKSALVKDIVSSIAKIPDPIKRSLYIRECSAQVQLEERILVNEINKILTRSFKKKQQQLSNEQWAGPEPPPTFGEEIGAPPPPTALLKKKAEVSSGDTFQEKDIVRILIEAGDQIFDKEENVTIAEYILGNIEDVIEDFDNKGYQTIAKECLQLLLKNEVPSSSYFINHQDENIRKTAINLITSPYEYSENWEKMHEIFLQTQKKPEENFTKDSIQSLKRFKLKKIMRMCNKNQEKIKAFTQSGEMDQLIAHMKVQQKLLDIRNELAKELGTVVLK